MIAERLLDGVLRPVAEGPRRPVADQQPPAPFRQHRQGRGRAPLRPLGRAVPHRRTRPAGQHQVPRQAAHRPDRPIPRRLRTTQRAGQAHQDPHLARRGMVRMRTRTTPRKPRKARSGQVCPGQEPERLAGLGLREIAKLRKPRNAAGFAGYTAYPADFAKRSSLRHRSWSTGMLRGLRGHFQPYAYSARDRRRQMTARVALSRTDRPVPRAGSDATTERTTTS